MKIGRRGWVVLAPCPPGVRRRLQQAATGGHPRGSWRRGFALRLRRRLLLVTW